MNILFTCAGRRNYLLEYFREALDGKGMIVAADIQATAPAMAVADKAIVVPAVYDKHYIDALLDVCQKEKIQAILSLNDLELPVLVAAKNRFDRERIKVIVPGRNVVNTCFDKWETTAFAATHNIHTPKTFLSLQETIMAIESGAITFPLVIKPRWGSASIGIEYPESLAELELAHRLLSVRLSRSILSEASRNDPDHAILIQEKMSGTEYGLDILNDFNESPVQVFVKEKLAMRAGETDKAVLRNIPGLEALGFRIGKALGHIGNLDCDLFETNGRYCLLEMNPRFGGGYPFSQITGADYPAAIIAWLQGRHFDFSKTKKVYDQPYAKCDTLIKTP